MTTWTKVARGEWYATAGEWRLAVSTIGNTGGREFSITIIDAATYQLLASARVFGGVALARQKAADLLAGLLAG
jgi:hypothetical protein